MGLVVFNTLSGKKEPFESLEPGKVRMYVCGPTVYDMAHVGHARVYVAFDVVLRYLRRTHQVTYARNYTDVDDKIIKRANSLGEPPASVSERFIHEFKVDMDALGILRPDVEPKVTEHIPQIVALVQRLIDKGYAYAAGGDVYYAVEKFADYGKLARRSLDDMQAGARVEPGELKKNPLDFALWKAAKPGEPSWPSPWGAGRPGWHIECSAMTCTHLGETFDLHAGGKDLVFPHHENEIAQSEAASGVRMVKYWLHNGFVTIDNEKMSKSLGNFFTVRQVLEKFDPTTLRYFLLATHYRAPINFSDQALRETEVRVKYIYETLARLNTALAQLGPGPSDGKLRDGLVAEILPRFVATMDDDFNTAKVLGDVSDAFKLVNEILDKPGDPAVDAATLRALRAALTEVGSTLGLFLEEPGVVLARMEARRQKERGVDPAEVERLIAERAAARDAKDYKRADDIRKDLLARGVVLKDSGGKTTWEAT